MRRLIKVRPSLSTYFIFTAPAFLLGMLFAAAYQGRYPQFYVVVILFLTLVVLISGVIALNRIYFDGAVITLGGVHRTVVFAADEVSLKLALRARSHGEYRVRKSVGYILEINAKAGGDVLFAKNVKIFGVEELRNFLFAAHDDGVIVDIDAPSRHTLGI